MSNRLFIAGENQLQSDPTGMPLDLFFATYTIRLGINITLDGDPCEALVNYRHREIWVDAEVIPRDWPPLVRHELAHTLEYHWATPRTVEERVEFSASTGAFFDRVFAAAGGLVRMQRLPVFDYRSRLLLWNSVDEIHRARRPVLLQRYAV